MFETFLEKIGKWTVSRKMTRRKEQKHQAEKWENRYEKGIKWLPEISDSSRHEAEIRYPWLLFRAQKQLRNSDYRAVAVIGLVTHAIKQAHNDVHNITMALLERRHKERQWVNAWRPHWDYWWMDEMQTMPVWGEPARWNNINNKAALLWATKWLLESSCSYLDEQVFIQ